MNNFYQGRIASARSDISRFFNYNVPVKPFIAVLLTMALTSGWCYAIELTGVINSHDPAGIIKDGNRYWHFTTGEGVWASYSDNLTHWTPAQNPVFPAGTWPSWINSAVPGFNGHFWAPDVIYMNGYYYLYYSASTFGSSRSAIGVARSPSLNNPGWQDLGMVVSSDGSSSAINAIDPGLFRDSDGRVYMTYGSWFGGMGVVEIDPSTGKTTGGVTHIAGGAHQDMEAPYIVKEGNYYYLFVNRGSCCEGLNSTYYIQVARSTNVNGPYSGWRTILNSSGKYVGPGHVGLLRENGMNYVSVHYYDGSDNGAAKLDILSMTFSGGWPSLTRNFTIGDGNDDDDDQNGESLVNGGVYRITPRHAQSKALEVYNFETGNGGNVVQYAYWGGDPQKWTATDAGDGYWRLSPVNSSGRAMDVSGISSADGANIQIWDYWSGAGQQWSLQDAGGGWYRVVSRHSGKCLDVNDASGADGANLIQWSCFSDSHNQQFRFEEVGGAKETASEALDGHAHSFYPNPAKDALNLRLPHYKDGLHTINLYGSLGNLLLSRELPGGEHRLDISGMPSGAFMIEIRTGSTSVVKHALKL